MLENIPAELRVLPQWVCAGPDKNPINPRTGQQASVSDPNTWATFNEAKAAGYKHVGFVLTKDDPYCIIDLDEPQNADQADRHQRIYNAFNSYAELSQSGKGVHIVVKGHIPSGVRRDKVELYYELRYMIFTGNVLRNAPITDHQPLLEQMHHEIQSTVVAELQELAPTMTDEAIFEMASGAANGDKFNRLCAGDLTGYPSQSEADFALLTILCFYSKSDSQVRRLFRYSALGTRDKAIRNDDYIDRCLVKIRGRQTVPMVDLSGLINQPQLPLEFKDEPLGCPPPPPPISVNTPAVLPPPPPPAPSILYPPGLIGEMAEYIYSSAIRPVHEVALAAAIGLGAGMVGRYFNISSTGLNQYIILLAETGTGKEAIHGGIDALLASIRAQVPTVDEFVGPGTFASGQALTRVLDKNPCFVSVLGEVGLTLQQICDKNAAAHQIQLRKVLLDVFAKSGHNKWLRPSAYSDTEKNTGLVRAPNVTIIGESTPTRFYGALDSDHISEGLVPRFFTIEYTGPRPPKNPRAFHPPSPGLVVKLQQLAQTVITMRANDSCCPVQVDQHADTLLEIFNVKADDMINGAGDDDVTKQLWNRAHIKALKLAGLVAVGVHPNQPIVTREIAQWAIDLVSRDIANMTAKFAGGSIGTGDHTQEADIRKACERYPAFTQDQLRQYKVPVVLLDKPGLIPHCYLKRYLMQRASFRNDKRGAVTAIKIAVDDMVKAGTLAVIPQIQAKQTFNLDSPIYYRGETW